MYAIEHYLTANKAADPYMEWLRSMRDITAKVGVVRRVARVERGNFGDHKHCRDGVWELRIDIGQGYRVYYAHTSYRGVLLLGGGNKPRQNADITQAIERWHDWQRRTDNETQQTPR